MMVGFIEFLLYYRTLSFFTLQTLIMDPGYIKTIQELIFVYLSKLKFCHTDGKDNLIISLCSVI